MIKRLLYTLIVMLATTPMAMASSYLINITSNDGGNVKVNKMSGSAEAGDLIKVFIHPDNDLWALQSLSIVRDDNGSNIDYDDYYDQNYEAYSFTMPASNVSINATFMRAFYSITVNNDDADGQGYATVDVTRAATDSVVTATVTPLDGFRIMGLQVIEDNTGNEIIPTSIANNQYSFTIGYDDVTVTPLFTPAPDFPIYTGETQNGTINTDVSGFEGANMFAYTEPERGYVTDSLWVMVETENAAPYQLEGVTKIGENSYIFIMPECVSVTIYATFKKADYFVNYENGIEHGTVSETNPGAAHHFDDAVTLTITPEENYVLKHLTITDGEYNELEYTWITEGESLTFNMPYSSVVVDASFRYTIYEIEVCDVEHATITPNVNMAQVGDTVTFTITPDLGYMITEIKVLAGYEIHGGSNPHAPLKSQGMWYTQDEIHLNYIDDTHYSFVLPERFYDDITPNYTGETKFRIIASLQNLGPRVIWCEGNKTLYFDFEVAPQSEPQVGDTYNGQTITSLWIGDKALPSYGIPYWTSAVNEQAEHVVFMPEFANARPTSCYYWFYYFKKINEFEGLEYLNTSQVTDMTQMFDDCWSLEKINVNNFDMTNVTSVNKMFFLCTSLTTIWCDSTWNIANSDNMFTYDDYLVGATAYRDSRISNGTKANPVDGYF
ncbi:MAG: BspA family leucine-rich repeat surface protein, partial [Muribaculaceae bacterium]|nr:BspA family leucine-rich repeat surface protein [Muribaculaceae bacterium]